MIARRACGDCTKDILLILAMESHHCCVNIMILHLKIGYALLAWESSQGMIQHKLRMKGADMELVARKCIAGSKSS